MIACTAQQVLGLVGLTLGSAFMVVGIASYIWRAWDRSVERAVQRKTGTNR